MTMIVILSMSKDAEGLTKTPAATYTTIRHCGWEGAANPEPEDLPDQLIIIQLSGERHEDLSV